MPGAPDPKLVISRSPASSYGLLCPKFGIYSRGIYSIHNRGFYLRFLLLRIVRAAQGLRSFGVILDGGYLKYPIIFSMVVIMAISDKIKTLLIFRRNKNLFNGTAHKKKM